MSNSANFKKISKIRRDQQELTEAMRQAIADKKKTEETLLALSLANPNSAATRRSVTKHKNLKNELTVEISKLERQRIKLNENFSGIADRLKVTKPQDLIKELSDLIPMMLLPVKLETRFTKSGRQNQLKIRIFPDTVSIQSLNKFLNEDEIKVGQSFWSELAKAWQYEDVEKRAIGEEGAVAALALATNNARALWIAIQTRPSNWPEKEGQRVPKPDDLSFKKIAGKDVSTPAQIGLLPDRFVISLYGEKNALLHEISGAPIPDNLMVGPDADGVSASIERDKATGNIVSGQELEWLFSFDKAEAVGMAITIPLSAAEARKGFEKIVALGVRYSEDAQSSAALVAEHLTGLRFSTGAEILPQGSPTNNTEDGAAAHSSAASQKTTQLLEQIRAPFASLEKEYSLKPDGQRFSDAMGLEFDQLTTWPNANRTDICEALSMNRVLWPATLGNYISEFLSPLKGSKGLEQAISSFATNFVTGRGTLPAIKVGRQPYGIMVTSNLDQYDLKESRLGAKSPYFPHQLKPLMDQLTGDFEELLNTVQSVSKGTDVSQTVLDILGLHPTSVNFESRKAVGDEVSWNALALQNAPEPIRRSIFDWLEIHRNLMLKRYGIEGDTRGAEEIVFLDETDALTGAVVDGDPKVPLSETKPIRPYMADKNYIDWLITESEQNIRSKNFGTENGKRINAPTALLFQYLRHAYISELSNRSLELATSIKPQEFKEQLKPTFITVLDSPSRFKNLSADSATFVNAKHLGLGSRKITTGQRLIDQARLSARPFAGRSVSNRIERRMVRILAAYRRDLEKLAPLPTARLERLFVEHMDTGSYRIDAWHGGMFAGRLQAMRDKTPKGIQFGAYGYLENVRPRAKAEKIARSKIPDGLRPASGDVLSFPDNDGFIHAPSQSHAVTAAVLRNGYRTHANSDRQHQLSINLDSSRVRKALNLIEGIQNGQSLSALLGYELERGLHENHPGLELDEFIYVLRARFPLTSKRLVDVPDNGTPAEVIEARNVVDGYDFMEHARGKAYPWGISGLPTQAAKKAAIMEELENLDNQFDAVGDLMLSESVHQTVNGSTERGRSALQALTEGDIPPLPEIAQTPRGGFPITQKLISLMDKQSYWGAKTQRALLNPKLNGWVAAKLPSPKNIIVGFRRDNGSWNALTLETAGLEPIDLVMMADMSIGSGNSALERWLIYNWRSANLVDDAVITSPINKPVSANGASILHFDADLPGNSSQVSLVRLLPHLMSLKNLVTNGRTTHCGDFRPPTSSDIEDASNPLGYVRQSRKLAGYNRLRTAFSALQRLQTDLSSITTDETNLAAYEELKNQDANFNPAYWSSQIRNLRKVLHKIFQFGIVQSLPSFTSEITALNAKTIFELGLKSQMLLKARLETCSPLVDEVTADIDTGDSDTDEASALRRRAKLMDRTAKALFGSDYRFITEFRLDTGGAQSVELNLKNPIVSSSLKLSKWVFELARVRDGVSDFSMVRDGIRWLGKTQPPFAAVQLPPKQNAQWVGAKWKNELEPDDYVNIMLENPPGDLEATLCGLVLDDFSETVPTKTETTAVSFHYDRPNAEAPQAILLVVPPQITGNWTWDKITGSILDTFHRARLRAIEPATLAETSFHQIAPANLLPFSAGGALSTQLIQNSVGNIVTGERQ